MNSYLNKHFENEFNNRDVVEEGKEQDLTLYNSFSPKVVQLSFINFPELKHNNHDFGYLDMENESLD